MSRVFVSVLFILLSPILFVAQGQSTSDQRSLAFTHVTVIDATGAAAQPDMTVVISGNRITELGKSGTVAIPQNAQVTDAKGQFLIPGLWDMHAHAFLRKTKYFPGFILNLNVANGVTGFADFGDTGLPDDFGLYGWIEDLHWRRAIAAGAIIGPRLVMAGVFVDGPEPGRPGYFVVGDERKGREVVTTLKTLNVDFIKVYDRIPRAAYFALADEAKKQGMPFMGHVPFAVSAGEASDAGQKSIEHLSGILLASSNREDELMKPANRGPHTLQHLVESYNQDKAARLFARFVKNGTYQIPTLIREGQQVEPEGLLNDPRVKYSSAALREEYAGRVKNWSRPEAIPAIKLRYQSNLRLVGAMKRAGVKIMAGTDANLVLFGFLLHKELEQLVKAGLTPMEALQSATRTPAEFFGKLDSMGTVEKGKLADLVLLDANPLEAIGNTQKISAVVVNGRLLDRKALDEMLAQVEAAAVSR
jgi:imidazolonepropionase-like amidohydrolase